MTKFGIPRLALLASASALVLAACSNGTEPDAVGPKSSSVFPSTPVATIGIASAQQIQICIDPASPAGVYSVGLSAPVGVVATDIVATSPASVGQGFCTVVLDRVSPPPGSAQFDAAFITSTLSIPAGVTPGGTWSFTCVPDAKRGDYCVTGTPLPPPDLTQTKTGAGNVVVTGSSAYHGTTTTFLYTPPIESACYIGGVGGYPNNNYLPRSAVVFNEDVVLGAAAYKQSGQELRAWYHDEHALLLGVRQVVVHLNPPPDYIANHAIATMSGNPSSANGGAGLLLTGEGIILNGSGNPIDGSPIDGYNRPLFPAVFITDLTVNGASSTVGDWQRGGTAYRPYAIYGTWKAAVANSDWTQTPHVNTIALDADPAKNHLNVGAPGNGALGVPAGVSDVGYSAELLWTAASLGLNPTHNYRLQFMVHDGDQNKTGGDVGEACMNIGPNVANRQVVY